MTTGEDLAEANAKLLRMKQPQSEPCSFPKVNPRDEPQSQTAQYMRKQPIMVATMDTMYNEIIP